ncbi:FAD-dependent oxidoreductase [Lachnospiraceae bacterium ZAX-1]
MIRIQQLKLPITHTESQLVDNICRKLKIPREWLKGYTIVKQSLDARKKSELQYVYAIDAQTVKEKAVLKKAASPNIIKANDTVYEFPQMDRTLAQSEEKDHGSKRTAETGKMRIPLKGKGHGSKCTTETGKMCVSPKFKGDSPRPVIIGCGPAGLFCAYILAEYGYAPIIVERGRQVAQRKKDIELFWETNQLNPFSNVQFGEGGAGTFSDGKLNTLVKDVKGRNKKVLDIFIKMGAPKEIAYVGKPHIGTDILINVIYNMRKHMEHLGATFLFETCVTNIECQKGHLKRLICTNSVTNAITELEANAAVLAVGHSARDTFRMLAKEGFLMEAKSFAVGLRVEHPQEQINVNQYGKEAANILLAAPYKLTANLKNGRGVYSFCMCPGGYVVNASSEHNRLAINGMSYSKRDGANANSAVIVTVTPMDFSTELDFYRAMDFSDHFNQSNDILPAGADPLSGVFFQQALEERAYQIGSGKVPQQLLSDFEKGHVTQSFGVFESNIKGQHMFGALHELFPKEIKQSFLAGMHQFSNQIKGFDRSDCILSGVESRTSSPLRIKRDAGYESNRKGIYPCGEGAGYAGGIMSAAIDGLKVAEALAMKI